MSEPTLSRLSRSTRDWLSGTVLAPYADSYVQYLVKQGYATSTIDTYLRSIAHFSRWATRRQISLDNIKESVVSRFLEKHLPVCRCARHCRRSRVDVRAALSHLLAHLRQENIIAAKAAVISNFIAAELEAFGGFLTDVRGLCDVTQQTRLAHVHRFLLDRFPEGPVRIGALLPKDIDQFIMKKMKGWKPSSLKAISNSLRSYLRFKATRGVQTACLIAALPRIAQWRLAGLPKALTAGEIDQFLQSFDQRTATGRRDYAISRCFVDLGLRTSEIWRLQLDDVIWREGVLRIHGKGRRIDSLPLPRTTGRAIADYLCKGRPRTASRALFLRHRPPFNSPAGPTTIRAVVRNAAQRCGLGLRLTGPHIPRHTLANRLIKSGATLKEIADLLRHRSIDTSTIYTKVDFNALEKIAAPWPVRKV